MVWVWDKEQVSVERREKYSTCFCGDGRGILNYPIEVQDPFMQAEETEKWALGNYLQTEVSWAGVFELAQKYIQQNETLSLWKIHF